MYTRRVLGIVVEWVVSVRSYYVLDATKPVAWLCKEDSVQKRRRGLKQGEGLRFASRGARADEGGKGYMEEVQESTPMIWEAGRPRGGLGHMYA